MEPDKADDTFEMGMSVLFVSISHGSMEFVLGVSDNPWPRQNGDRRYNQPCVLRVPACTHMYRYACLAKGNDPRHLSWFLGSSNTDLI